jgi:hypothetical protein
MKAWFKAFWAVFVKGYRPLGMLHPQGRRPQDYKYGAEMRAAGQRAEYVANEGGPLPKHFEPYLPPKH